VTTEGTELPAARQAASYPVAIGARFPGWRAWISQTGRWWAIRDTTLTAAQISAGCLPLLHADNGEHLVARIGEQETLRGQDPAERLITRLQSAGLSDCRPGHSGNAKLGRMYIE
jgi:hypothetical protein